MNRLKYLLPFLLVLCCAFVAMRTIGCNEADQQTRSEVRDLIGDRESFDSANLKVLLIGNSHTMPIPDLMTKLYRRQHPDLKTFFQAPASFGFLVDHAQSPVTRELIETGKWDYVVLQGQKYSTSGKYDYPIDGAITLSELAKSVGSKIIMYPEWPRKDAPDEYARIRALHDSIAEQTGAYVAPIGEAWELARQASPDLEMYDADGNHASTAGSYLNACVIYALIENKSPERTEFLTEGHSTFPPEYEPLEKSAWQAVEADRE